MKSIAYQRCYNHASREAAARCLECTRFFCRECVSEHEDRLICASCLAKLRKSPLKKTSYLHGLVKIFQLFLAFMILWCSFYLLGQMLAMVPGSFHEGTLWQSMSPENE